MGCAKMGIQNVDTLYIEVMSLNDLELYSGFISQVWQEC